MARLDKSLTDDLGTEFGPYELVRRLGVGGTAETYEAIRRGAGGFTQRVCLKIVLPFYRDDEAFARMFQREAMLAAKLRHRNIVGVIDFGEVDGRSFIAFELVDGIDLRTLLDTYDRNRLDSELVTLVGLELAAALLHAHQPPSGSGFEGLVHRDISPANVLISRQGEVMLTDFGVAKPSAEQRRKSSSAKGKFPYMSPEQLRGEVVDARSDLFSVGVVLFEALAGVRPYEGPNDPATIMLILNGDHAELIEWAPDAPPKLCNVIERLIHPNADQRLQTATELIEELAELAPSPRIQARLGALVEERMDVDRGDAREVSSTVGKTPADFAAEASSTEAVLGQQHPGAAAPTKAGSHRRIALALLGALLVIGVVAAGVWSPKDEADTAVDPNAGTGAVADADADTVADTGTGTVADTVAGADTGTVAGADTRAGAATPPLNAVPTKPAHLDIIVVPWGDIWINGKRWGAAPMMNETLKPGRYRVSAGQDNPSKTRTIRLRPGDRKTINFDLTQ